MEEIDYKELKEWVLPDQKVELAQKHGCHIKTIRRLLNGRGRHLTKKNYAILVDARGMARANKDGLIETK